MPTYTEACPEPEQYQKTFEPPYSSRPASGFLLVSFSKVTRHLLALFASTLLAESLPKKANDYSFLIFSELRRLGKISVPVANSKGPKLASWEILLRSSDVQKPKEVRIETRNENADNRDARAGPVPRDWFARGRSRAAEALERFAHDVDENDSICKVDRSELNENGVSFLRTELDLGNTFVGIAQSADKDQEKAERNRAHGRKAYDSVLRFLPDVSLTTAEQTEIQDKLAVLKAALMALGEVFA